MATYGHWIFRSGAGCEVIQYMVGGKIRGVLVRAAGSDQWVAKVGGIPVGIPTSKGNAEKMLRNKIRRGKEDNNMSNTMTKAELAQRIAYLESLVVRSQAAQEPAPAKKRGRPRKATVAKAVEVQGRKLKSPPVYAGGPTWGQVTRAKAIVAKEHGRDLRPSEFKAAVNAVLAGDGVAPFYGVAR